MSIDVRGFLPRLFLALALCVFSSVAARAAVIVVPSSPQAGEGITIRVENSFGAQAEVLSASIQQSGNTFFIEQNVRYACTLPSNPTVASTFAVGPLLPGEYNVVATVNFAGEPPALCARAPLVQEAAFSVAAPAVPALGPAALAILAALIAAAGLVALTFTSS